MLADKIKHHVHHSECNNRPEQVPLLIAAILNWSTIYAALSHMETQFSFLKTNSVLNCTYLKFLPSCPFNMKCKPQCGQSKKQTIVTVQKLEQKKTWFLIATVVVQKEEQNRHYYKL